MQIYRVCSLLAPARAVLSRVLLMLPDRQRRAGGVTLLREEWAALSRGCACPCPQGGSRVWDEPRKLLQAMAIGSWDRGAPALGQGQHRR